MDLPHLQNAQEGFRPQKIDSTGGVPTVVGALSVREGEAV